jgi:hypothetical protein
MADYLNQSRAGSTTDPVTTQVNSVDNDAGSGDGAWGQFWGGDSLYDKVRNAVYACDHDSLNPTITAWGSIKTTLDGIESKLSSLVAEIQDGWTDENGKQAANSLTDAQLTTSNLRNASLSMGNGLSYLYDSIKLAKQNMSEDSGWHYEGDSWSSYARESYNIFIKGVNDSLNIMPNTYSTSTLSGNSDASSDANHHNNSTPQVGGLPSPGGGGGAPHVGTPGGPHVPTTPTPSHPTTPTVPTHPVGPGTPDYPTHPGSHDPSHFPGTTYPGSSHGSGVGGAGGIDSGASLAGFDGAGAGGAGAFGAGSPSGLGGAGGGLGSTAGGAGLGSAGGSGAGGVGAGSGAIGGPGGVMAGRGGMMGGHGGGAGDEEERERSTWLTEDEDVWGGGPSGSTGVI